MKLKVGQKLWLVPGSRHSEPREVTVTKVGRKWAYIDGYYHSRNTRVDMETLVLDGTIGYPDHCYLSKKAWEESTLKDRVWSAIRDKMRNSYRRPDHLSTEDLRAIEAFLGLEPTE